ncbi:hypothetical protein EJ08DRAFT_697119 [Tothia fuscella]|uniref:Uncharacterized protein n=1 Tax=Tothia fuscella TaxID=1048955 RepID=A0A9P4NS40_9PEZI|nr:hypothetical protein EJ08DRAFT_697119 [Tothia fuscella]
MSRVIEFKFELPADNVTDPRRQTYINAIVQAIDNLQRTIAKCNPLRDAPRAGPSRAIEHLSTSQQEKQNVIDVACTIEKHNKEYNSRPLHIYDHMRKSYNPERLFSKCDAHLIGALDVSTQPTEAATITSVPTEAATITLAPTQAATLTSVSRTITPVTSLQKYSSDRDIIIKSLARVCFTHFLLEFCQQLLAIAHYARVAPLLSLQPLVSEFFGLEIAAPREIQLYHCPYEVITPSLTGYYAKRVVQLYQSAGKY